MSILFVLIPLSLVLMAVAVWALFWAIDHGQFDELDACSRSILDDDEMRQDTVSVPATSGESG